MYRIKFYRSRDGKKPVLEYLRGLTKKNDKDSRIKANKIRDYIKTLSHYGTAIGEPYIVRNWTAIYGNSGLYRTGYSLLHGSEKVFFLLATLLKRHRKLREERLKKPNDFWMSTGKGAERKMANSYEEALQEARAALEDIKERGEDAIGEDWEDVEKELFTPQEIAESNLRVAIMGELIRARQERGISQKKLEEMSGVKQPVIARMEKGYTSPQIDTLLKVLAPLGKTLAIVPLQASTEA